jgi:TolB protein
MPPAIKGKTLLNRYTVEAFAASTPLGELYRVTDERSGRPLALTLLPQKIAENVEAIKELESKSGRLQNITHPNLTKYLGLFQTPTLAFLLEEWVDGPSFADIIKDAPIGAEEALIHAKAVCNALEALHKQNFLHLNLAPELIRVNKNGEAILGGVPNAHPLGNKTPRKLNKYPLLYTSPEEIQKEAPGTAADMYSLGVILYQLVTGAWINGKAAPKTIEAIRNTHLETTPPSPASLNKDLPDHFARMILWALRKNPDDRFKTTTELLSALALAVRIPVDKIPLRAAPETAPITSGILSGWKFLPPPKPTILSDDAAPLEDRLATIAAPKKKTARRNIIPIFLLAMTAGIASLFWLIRPAESPVILPEQLTSPPLNFTSPPTLTPIPKPTDPHGGRIAFTCTRGDFNQLCMVNRDGSGLIQLTDMEASNYYPAFPPDGDSLLFASNRNGAFDLYRLVFNEKELVQITNNIGNVISPDFSPDGRYIVFANRAGSGPTSVWMVNADGLNPRLVYTGSNDIVATAWSPDGERIAYAMSVGIPQEYEIFVMDTDGRNHVRISQGLKGIGGSVDWSPDGRYVLVHAGPFGGKDIFKIEVETQNFIQLTDGGNNAGASFSPDGNYIVFNSLRNNEQADLYIMRSDGTNQTQLTNHPEPDWGARWVD